MKKREQEKKQRKIEKQHERAAEKAKKIEAKEERKKKREQEVSTLKKYDRILYIYILHSIIMQTSLLTKKKPSE